MRITIENVPVGSEPEIIIRCNDLDESLLQLIYSLNSTAKKIVGVQDSQTYLLEHKEVYYFEAVDNKVFIYCKEKVLESKLKLYQIESEYQNSDFFRASKSIVLNITKIKYLKPDFNGRCEALLINGEKVIISRQYVPILKRKLGLKEETL